MKLRLLPLLLLALLPLACGPGSSEAERVEKTVLGYLQASSDGEWKRVCDLASPKWARQMSLMARVGKIMERGKSKASFNFEGDPADCPRLLQELYGEATNSPETDASFEDTKIEGLQARTTVRLKGYRPPGTDTLWPEVTYVASLEKSEGQWRVSSLLAGGLSPGRFPDQENARTALP